MSSINKGSGNQCRNWSGLSDWLPMGEVCVTTDFMPLNKSVILSRYMLPLPEEIFQKTRGSSVFFKLDLVKGQSTTLLRRAIRKRE